MKGERAVVIQDSSDDKDDPRQRLRKALNGAWLPAGSVWCDDTVPDVHWHNGRVRFYQDELETHIRAAERAACEAEDAFALSRGSSSDGQYDDSETEELMRSVPLSPGGSIIVEDPGMLTPSPSIKRSLPPRSPVKLLSPTPKKRARKGPKGGYLVLNGRDGVSSVFESWAAAAHVGQNVSGAIIQGFNSYEEAQQAYDACSSSGLLAYLSLQAHEDHWFAVLRGSNPGICQKGRLLDLVGPENLENVQVSDILVADTEAEARQMFKKRNAVRR
ncbi:hypothetical protein VNI00_018518 [Paramarasmius palmivorus]|uniref:Ribonuclease H1 N-terminal domain-containing protein n=1 Tax=Paramarasmius palmivorus TaxID=297713 RepID=A0AAW0AWQ2_9AGAR